MNDKQQLLRTLTGVGASKINYYTELKEKIREVEKRNAQLEILNQIVTSINVDTPLSTVIIRVAKLLNEAVPFSRLEICLPENSPALTTVAVKQGALEVTSEKEIPERLKEVLLPLAEKEHCLFNSRKEYIIPLRVKGLLLGVLVINGVTTLDQTDLEFIGHLAEHLSLSLENTQLYREVVLANLRWEHTFRAVTDHITFMDKELNLLRYNNAAAAFYNLTEGNTRSKCYSQLAHKDSPCNNCLVQEVITTGKPGHERKKVKGQVLDFFAYPVNNDSNELYGVIQYAKDVTDQVKMEGQLVQSAKLAATGEMAAGVAHELNSPLTAILGNGQLFVRELEQGGHKQLAENIVSCGKRSKNIIRNLLTFARQEETQFTEIDLNKCIEQVLTLVSFQIDNIGIDVKKVLYSNLPKVYANQQQIEQVLINLILNARDALKGRSEPAEIWLESGIKSLEGKDWVYVSIKDNGCGIVQEEISSVFQPFYTTKSSDAGTGLGLSVSLGIAQKHNGTITVESDAEIGSVFTLILPIIGTKGDV